MKRVYVSGPMTGREELNFPAFKQTTSFLRRLGFEVVCPTEISVTLPAGSPWSDYLRADLRELLSCDVLVVLEGAIQSRGARLECHVAAELGLPLLTVEELIERRSVAFIARVIRAHRFRYSSEEELQDGLAQALAAAGLPVEREVRLDSRNRIDIVVGRVGVEVKIDGSSSNVSRQCERYLQSDLLDGLVLVTSRVRHVHVGLTPEGKEFRVVTLAGAGL